MLQRPPSSPMRVSTTARRILLLSALSVLLTAGVSNATPNPRATVMRVEAESLAGDGDCVGAVDLLKRAREESSRDAHLAHLQGQCEIHLHRYVEAVRSLRSARRIRSDLPDLHLHLGMALFHTGDFQGAASSFREAAETGSVSPQLDLYRGLLLLSQHQVDEAARILERARTVDPGAVDPAASFYGAMANNIVGNREEAVRALERVAAEDPDGDWGRAARAALNRGFRRIPYWVNARVGFEYDNNVTLLGIHGGTPQYPSGQGDIRAHWHIDGGAQLLNTEKVTGGLLLSYTGSRHQDLSQFDVDYPTFSGWVDWRFADKMTLRARYDVGYSWTDSEFPFLFEQDLSASVFRDWGDWGTTELASRAFLANFLYPRGDQPDANPDNSCSFYAFAACGPLGLNEADYRNPDGVGVIIGLNHTYDFDFWNTAVWGGYFFELYEAHGKEYDRKGQHIRFGIETTLPFHEFTSRIGRGETVDFPLTVRWNFRWGQRDYDHATSYPDPIYLFGDTQPVGYTLGTRRRQDAIVENDVEVRYSILEQLVFSVFMRDVHHYSSTRVFDYRRRILGAQLTGSFP